MSKYSAESAKVHINDIPTELCVSDRPSAYRLAKKHDGTLVLQGSYEWWSGLTGSGHEWRDIPTVDIP